MELAFKIGADPEVFAFSKTTKTAISAHDLVPGTKDVPHKVQDGAVQVDGVALEFNINPASSADEFVRNINSVYGQMRQMATEKNPDVDFVLKPWVQFEKKVFDNVPAFNKQLGCEPDYNAYTGLENLLRQPAEGFRTTAGHLHIGWTDGEDTTDPDHFGRCIDAVKALDCTLGDQVVELRLDPENWRRQQLYGARGAFRPKPYGFEYRVLSNFWLRSEAMTRWVYDRTLWTMNKLTEGHVFAGRYTEAHLVKIGAPALPKA